MDSSQFPLSKHVAPCEKKLKNDQLILEAFITLSRSITMFCGTNLMCKIFHKISSVPHNTLMDLNSVVLEVIEGQLF